MLPKNIRPIRVFLCHASNDKPSVRRLYKKLREDRIDVWFDEEMLFPGQDWDAEIQKAVRMSDVVIICLSNKSVTKEGYVQKEIRIALDVAEEKPHGTIFIVPVRLENCDVPDRIKRWQWIDLFSSDAEIDESNFRKLIKSLEIRSEQIKSQLRFAKHDLVEFEPYERSFATYRAWIFPIPQNIFERFPKVEPNIQEIERIGDRLHDSFLTLGIPARIIGVGRGPRFIRFGLEPSFKNLDGDWIKVTVSEITSVVNDLSMISGVKIVQVQPVASRSYIGVDILNFDEETVSLLDIFESKKYQHQHELLTFALGKGIIGEPILIDLSKSPNMLISGVANSGKSACITSVISSLLVNNSPNEMKILFFDARRVEFSAFSDVPHLLAPVVTDISMAIAALKWLIQEIDERKRLFSKLNVRNIDQYNSQAEFEEKLPFIIVFINELPDFMNVAYDKIEKMLTQIAGSARTTGIQTIISSTSLSSNVITESIKANVSNRIALRTLSSHDSQLIINSPGAEKLLGGGDMLFLGAGTSIPLRVQGVFVSDDEVSRLVEFWKSQTN